MLNWTSQDKVENRLLFLLLLIAFYFPAIIINVGFALKVTMLLIPLLIIFRPPFHFPLRKYDYALLFFGLSCCIAHAGAMNPALSLRMLMGFMIFLSIYFSFRPYFIHFFSLPVFLSWGLVFSTGCLFAYLTSLIFLFLLPGLSNYATGLLFDRGLLRMTGPVGSANYLSLYLFPVAFAAWENRAKLFKGAWLLPLTCILLSLSLSSYLSLIVAVFFGVLIFGGRFIPNIGKRISVMTLIITPIAIASIMLVDPKKAHWIQGITNRINSLSTGSGRYNMWETIITFFISHNVFSGIGLNNLQLVTKTMFGIVNIHNTYLEVLVEQGLLGLLSFGCFLLFMGVSCFHETQRPGGALWPFLTWIALLVNIFFVSATITPDILISYLIIIGFTECQKVLEKA